MSITPLDTLDTDTECLFRLTEGDFDDVHGAVSRLAFIVMKLRGTILLDAAVTLGAKGGRVRSERKAVAARKNGTRGGRPLKSTKEAK